MAYVEVRQTYMDFMVYLTSEDAKKRLMEEYNVQTLRNQELTARINQMVATVEQLLNAGVQTLNSRLHELDMNDVTSPADILNRSKQIVTAHKDITIQVSSVESEVLALERTIRTKVPYGQALIEKLDAADFSLEDPYGVLISQACAEGPSGGGAEEGEVQLPDHLLLSPQGTPARRPRQRPRPNTARRSGGAAGAAAAAAAAVPATGTQAAPGAAKADNDEVERQIAEIVQKALQVDSVAKEKERRARGAPSAAGTSAMSGGGGDRKRSGGTAAAAAASGSMPTTPVTSAAGAYAALSAAEMLRFQLPSFEQAMDSYPQHHQDPRRV